MVQFKGTSKNQKIPQWLENIQENSWEAELLLSAVMLFGLIQTPILLNTWMNQVFLWEDGVLRSLLETFVQGIEILRIGFILHLIVRALWIAQVGFSYVYPKGIRIDKLKFHGRFRRELEKSESQVNSIIKLEKVASMIFAISFSLFGLLIGLTFFVSPFMILALVTKGKVIVGEYKTAIVVFVMVYIFLSIPIFIDFITNGWLRRGKRRAKFFYPLSYFFRIMTLSFLYKKTLLTIISNVKGFRKYLISIGVVLIILFMNEPKDFLLRYKRDSYIENTKKAYVQKENYDSKRSDDDYLVATIPNDVINSNVLPVFIKDQGLFDLDKFDHETVEKDSSSTKIRFSKNELEDNMAAEAENLNKLIYLTIDEDSLKDVKWAASVHPKAYKRGFTSYLNISELENKDHRLKIYLIQTESDTLQQRKDSLLANIFFYKN